jgi:hypothetical protein
MSFGIDLPAAARRHLSAADDLENENRNISVAGYLYGIAAECALKAMMLDAGMCPDSKQRTVDDPFFAHFPELRTLLRDNLKGRRGTPLVRYVQNDSFMNNWSTRMRYAHGREIKKSWVKAWAEQARQAVSAIGT